MCERATKKRVRARKPKRRRMLPLRDSLCVPTIGLDNRYPADRRSAALGGTPIDRAALSIARNLSALEPPCTSEPTVPKLPLLAIGSAREIDLPIEIDADRWLLDYIRQLAFHCISLELANIRAATGRERGKNGMARCRRRD